MKNQFFSFLKICWILLSALIIWINFSLYSRDTNQAEKDLIRQLNFIDHQLKEGKLGERMQQIYPEGFIFINVLYGLTWCELSRQTNNQSIKKKALKEALYAYEQVTAPEATWNFDADISPEYGIFYLGWNNYLLSKILQTDVSFPERNKYIRLYETQCNLISITLQKTKFSVSTFLRKYGLASRYDSGHGFFES